MLGVAACGDDDLSLSEYANQVEAEMAVMNTTIDELDDAMRNAQSVEEAQQLWRRRIEARERFVGFLAAVDPPASAAELHATAQDIVTRLTEAEAAMAERAEDYTSVTELGRIWNSAEGRAARDVDQEAIELCRAAQAKFDGTADRETLQQVAWITDEMKEVVDVVFGCTAEDRGVGT